MTIRTLCYFFRTQRGIGDEGGKKEGYHGGRRRKAYSRWTQYGLEGTGGGSTEVPELVSGFSV